MISCGSLESFLYLQLWQMASPSVAPPVEALSSLPTTHSKAFEALGTKVRNNSKETKMAHKAHPFHWFKPQYPDKRPTWVSEVATY